jgi:hypothetical protein
MSYYNNNYSDDEGENKENISFNTRVTPANIAKRIEQLQNLQSLLRYKAKMDEYQKQIARGKQLIHIKKEAKYNRENRVEIDLGDGTYKVSRYRWLPKELEEDDSY